jgi:predicted outer membrane repeat protein
VYCLNQALAIQNSTFIENHSVVGGAVYSSDPAVIAESVFSDNTGSGSDTEYFDWDGTTIDKYRGSGGAVHLRGSAEISGCQFENNSSNLGGAVFALGEVTLSDSELAGNTALSGGAVFSYGEATTVVAVDSVFYDNATNLPCDEHMFFDSSCHSGGAFSAQGGTLGLESCVVGGNTAVFGGALHLAAVLASHWVLNTTIYGNTATAEGTDSEEVGAAACAYVSGGGSEASFSNSVVFGNQADDGTLAFGEVVFDHSLVEGGAEGSGNIDADPLFVDPDGEDFHLQSISPAIDSADGPAAPEFDIEGNPRADDPDTPNIGVGPPWADLGAFEYQP